MPITQPQAKAAIQALTSKYNTLSDTDRKTTTKCFPAISFRFQGEA